MKTPPRPPPARGRRLSKEDEALWDSMAATIMPLKRKTPQVERARADAPSEPPAAVARKPASHVPQKVPEPRAAAPPVISLDPKTVRRIRSGRAEIEARLDLHGMRQREAHAALRRFLLSCHARGLRLVLVITGKGSSAGDGERGVLKRSVPAWLSEPEVRVIVVSTAPAAPQHGGEGALYVRLRKPERMGR